jgi:hypothetical protein
MNYNNEHYLCIKRALLKVNIDINDVPEVREIILHALELTYMDGKIETLRNEIKLLKHG